MTIHFILLLIAFGCFVAAAFGVRSPVNLTAAGLAFLVLSMLIGA